MNSWNVLSPLIEHNLTTTALSATSFPEDDRHDKLRAPTSQQHNSMLKWQVPKDGDSLAETTQIAQGHMAVTRDSYWAYHQNKAPSKEARWFVANTIQKRVEVEVLPLAHHLVYPGTD
jgi:hypothetical protein